jgi:hypothetical protein
MIAPRDLELSTIYEKAYAQAAHDELDNGLLRGAAFVCKDCCKQLPKPANAKFSAFIEQTLDVPSNALVNGYFRGKCPNVILRLNRTELSLIGLVDLIYTLSLLPQGCHYKSSATVWSVLNNLAEISQYLPNNPTVEQWAIIKSSKDGSPRDYRYRPSFVWAALLWLSKNNVLYKDKLRVPLLADGTPDPKWLFGGSTDEFELPFMAADDASDYIEIHAQSDIAGEDGHAVNSGAPPSNTSEVFLQLRAETPDLQQRLRSAIVGETLSAVYTCIRGRGDTSPDYKTDNFLQMAFVHLYPYGKGGPDNISVKIPFNASYIQYALKLGGQRSFQQSPSFMFYSYTWSMKKALYNIVVQTDKPSGTNHDRDMTVGEAQAVLSHLSGVPGICFCVIWFVLFV